MAEHIIDGIRVIVEKDGSGLFFATSPDENIVIAKPTVEAALAAVPEVLRRLALMREIMERDDEVLKDLGDK
jgi:hypothetical protein